MYLCVVCGARCDCVCERCGCVFVCCGVWGMVLTVCDVNVCCVLGMEVHLCYRGAGCICVCVFMCGHGVSLCVCMSV